MPPHDEGPGLRGVAVRFLRERADELAEEITQRHYGSRPDEAVRDGDSGRAKCRRDVGYHLSYLTEALAVGRPEMFVAYAEWVCELLAALGIAREAVAHNLSVTREVIEGQAPAPIASLAAAYLERARERLRTALVPTPSFIRSDTPEGVLAASYLTSLLAGDRAGAAERLVAAADDGVPLRTLYLDVIEPAQHEVGRLWQTGQVSVAQEHFCSVAAQYVLGHLHARAVRTPRRGRRLVAACVPGEMHDIGLRMVADLLEAEGWDTLCIGANTPSGSLAALVDEWRPDVLALSVSLTPNLPGLTEVLTRLRAAEETRALPVMVGGYALKSEEGLWRDLGADGFAADAREALTCAEALAEGRRS